MNDIVMLSDNLLFFLREEGINESSWDSGYVEEDVNIVLPVIQYYLENIGVRMRVIMYWENFSKSWGFDGDSELFLYREEGGKIHGCKVTIPIIEKGNAKRFVQDVIRAQENPDDFEELDFKFMTDWNAAFTA